MVTLDKIVQNVGKFEGKLKDYKQYERAKEGKSLLEEDEGMLKLEDNLKKETGYSDFNLPNKPVDYEITAGEITFNIRSETTTKRPAYMKAVTQMETYISGISLLLSEERTITGVAKENNKWCISVDKLLEQYEVIIAGLKSPGIRQIVKYTLPKGLEKELLPKELSLATTTNGELNENNFLDYVKKDLLKDTCEKYVKAYEKQLNLEKKQEGIVAVTTERGYKQESTKAEGVDWAYVVKTLVSEDKKFPGELNILANPNISFEQKIEQFPKYDLFMRTPYGESTLYIGIQSVYNRIQELKNDKTLEAQTVKYTPKDLV